MSRQHNTLNRRWAVSRRAALDRDGWRCQFCGRAGRLEVDHITPMADGGQPYDLTNLQALCGRCHIRKTADENRARRPVPAEVQRWRDVVREVATFR